MHFVSFEFLLFLAIVLGLYSRLAHSWQNRWLLAASYVFYGWWDWRFLGLIVLSSVVDFVCGQIADPNAATPRSDRARRAAVALSAGTNLGLLGLFKYFGFFVDSMKSLLGDHMALPWGLDTLDLILPVGISFYTFQTMSYTIDVYRGQLAPTRRLDEFLLYVAFFPQLVAGPIERGHRLLPQIQRPRSVTRSDLTSGAQLALFGFFQKMVVADNLGVYVSSVFTNPDATVSSISITLATYAFALQIYADFAGYTDIARGVARMLGFDLMRNFRTPYFATNPSDFWQRWHISLSSWLRDYLYIPLGGNRGGAVRTWRNLSITMLLGGLWHGAAWNYVLWGAYHAGLLAAFHLLVTRADARSAATIVRRGPLFWAKAVGYFHLTCFGWLIFRADSLEQLGHFLTALVNDHAVPDILASSILMIAVFALPLLLFDLHRYRIDRLEPWRAWPVLGQVAFQVTLIYAIVLLGTPHAADFIYFQF